VSATEREVLEWFGTLSNWSRWGDDDERGTLNFITPQTRVAAAGLVRLGESVSCARPITGEATVQPRRAEIDDHGSGFAMEDVTYPVHGVANTHLDALPHAFWQGRMFNGRTQAGDGVEAASTGIFTRGSCSTCPVSSAWITSTGATRSGSRHYGRWRRRSGSRRGRVT
jgi:hypothetical protein